MKKRFGSVKPVVIERTFDTSVKQLWNAITSMDEMKQWYFDLKEFRAEVGFEFMFDVGHKGFIYQSNTGAGSKENCLYLALRWT